MKSDKQTPKVGDVLVHRFRKRPSEVVAEVISVDSNTGTVSVKVGDVVYPSLSSAAQSVTGLSTNGWIFWGLKKQVRTPREP